MSARGGIDLGGTKIQTVVVDEAGEVRGESRVPTPTSGGPQDVADAMAGALREACEQAGVNGHLAGVGVGSPGVVDDEAGTVSSARNLPNWEGSFGLGGALGDALGAPVRLGNDVQVAVLGERKLGAGRSYESFLGVFWGTGVGGGVVIRGELWRGRGAAGEIGHVVVDRNGLRCPCGRVGCMEAYAGRKALEARARERESETNLFEIMEERGKDRLTAGIWKRALKRGDPVATELIDEAVDAVGTAVASALNLLDVDAVVIGGGLGLKLGDKYARRIEQAMLPHLFASDRPPPVVLAELGDLGGAIGASLLVDAG